MHNFSDSETKSLALSSFWLVIGGQGLRWVASPDSPPVTISVAATRGGQLHPRIRLLATIGATTTTAPTLQSPFGEREEVHGEVSLMVVTISPLPICLLFLIGIYDIGKHF